MHMMCRYSDYVRTQSGLQYQDLRPGTGRDAHPGARVTIDWDGYTVGYYGRPFEARNKVSVARPPDFRRAGSATGLFWGRFEARKSMLHRLAWMEPSERLSLLRLMLAGAKA